MFLLQTHFQSIIIQTESSSKIRRLQLYTLKQLKKVSNSSKSQTMFNSIRRQVVTARNEARKGAEVYKKAAKKYKGLKDLRSKMRVTQVKAIQVKDKLVRTSREKKKAARTARDSLQKEYVDLMSAYSLLAHRTRYPGEVPSSRVFDDY